MFSIQDLKKLPEIELGEARTPEEAQFSVSTLHVGDGASEWVTIEVSCQCVNGDLILSRARINRAGGGEVPECWQAQNIEAMLQELIHIRELEAGIMDEALRSERRDATLTSRRDRVSAALKEAAADFVASGSEYFPHPMDQLSEFMAICSNAFAEASKTNESKQENRDQARADGGGAAAGGKG